ncbi:trypsin-3-like [Malaya genurostris]|uniref:trypsin-3-like n=1 Tax=Malaya genurostris TaxID=325434 RepID=UPI0026F40481|nr:trypsin-3-like [Malaya genurostris]
MLDCAFPYLVAIVAANDYICVGSIVAPRWILTAAHCVDNFRNTPIYVRAGSPYRNRGGTRIRVLTVHIHPNYSAQVQNFDVGLLMLERNIKLDKCSQCISMAANGFMPSIGSMGLISGWGRTDPYSDKYQEKVQKTYIPIISKMECKHYYSRYVISRNVFCAQYRKGGYDACHGDSGAPFILDRKVVGIVSWGVGCGQGGQPGVYASVGSMRPWIDFVIRQESHTPSDLECS